MKRAGETVCQECSFIFQLISLWAYRETFIRNWTTDLLFLWGNGLGLYICLSVSGPWHSYQEGGSIDSHENTAPPWKTYSVEGMLYVAISWYSQHLLQRTASHKEDKGKATRAPTMATFTNWLMYFKRHIYNDFSSWFYCTQTVTLSNRV
jgi:hypothetical protein